MAMVVSSSKPSEREQNIGLIEMATGIGFLLGPIWGSAMYQIGGYSAPFGSTGKLAYDESRKVYKFSFLFSSFLRSLVSILRNCAMESSQCKAGSGGKHASHR